MDVKELKKIVRKTIKEVKTEDSVLLASPGLLKEASYNRIRHHIETSGVPFVMISAFRDERSINENQQLHKELKSNYKAAGFPFTELRAGYPQCPDTAEEDTETGICHDKETGEEVPKVDTIELSLLVYEYERPDVERTGDIYDVSVNLAQKYNQDSFIYGKPNETEEGGVSYRMDPKTKERNVSMDIQAYDKDGSLITADWAGPWSSVETAKESDVYWSKIFGRKWKLTEILDYYVNLKPQTMMEQQKRGWYIQACRQALKEINNRGDNGKGILTGQ